MTLRALLGLLLATSLLGSCVGPEDPDLAVFCEHHREAEAAVDAWAHPSPAATEDDIAAARKAADVAREQLFSGPAPSSIRSDLETYGEIRLAADTEIRGRWMRRASGYSPLSPAPAPDEPQLTQAQQLVDGFVIQARVERITPGGWRVPRRSGSAIEAATPAVEPAFETTLFDRS